MNPAAAARLCLGGLLNAENALTIETSGLERRALHDQSWLVLRIILRNARRWLRWWHKANRRLQNSTGITECIMEQSCRATEVLWAPRRQQMGQVHMGLHELQMWERRSNGAIMPFC